MTDLAAAPPAAALAPDLRAKQLRAFLLLIVGATAIGNSSVLVRLAEAPPAATAFWRMMFALPVLAAWAMWERRDTVGRPMVDPAFLLAGLVGGFAFAVDLTLSNIALGLTTMTSFIILVHLAPVVVVIVAWIWFRERPTPAILAALAMAIAGAVLLVQSGRGGPAPGNALLGDLASIAAAFGYAGFLLAMRRARMTAGAGLVSFVSAATCAVFCLLFALLAGESILPPTLYSAAMLAVMGVLCHAFGQGISAYAVGSLGASVTSIVLVYGVGVTVTGGWLFFGEVPNWTQAAGGALVLAAVMLCRPK
jgi:drug/metabolite transporter (DMT)-like permease